MRQHLDSVAEFVFLLIRRKAKKRKHQSLIIWDSHREYSIFNSTRGALNDTPRQTIMNG